MSYDSMEAQVEELVLYASNFSGEHYNGVGRELTKRWIGPNWDQNKALQMLYDQLVHPAAWSYKRELGSMTQSVDDMWPEGIRWAAACCLYDHFVSEFQFGNLWVLK